MPKLLYCLVDIGFLELNLFQGIIREWTMGDIFIHVSKLYGQIE